MPVSVHGLTVTGALVALLNVLVGGALVAFIRTRPTLTKIKNEREATLLEAMGSRIKDLEAKLDKEEAKREEAAAEHAAERAADRHRINNLTQCFDALLLLLKQSPDKAAEAVAMITEMRAKQMEAEAIEKSNIHAARIQSKSTGVA